MPRDSDLPYPEPSSAAVSAIMRGNRRSNTKPEVALRSALHRVGVRFRKDLSVQAGDVQVKVDIVFTRQHVAVFVDGCYWHCCPTHGHIPRANAGYWPTKLARNRERDRRVTEALKREGWTVLRLWEHVDPDQGVREVLGALEDSQGLKAPPQT